MSEGLRYEIRGGVPLLAQIGEYGLRVESHPPELDGWCALLESHHHVGGAGLVTRQADTADVDDPPAPQVAIHWQVGMPAEPDPALGIQEMIERFLDGSVGQEPSF